MPRKTRANVTATALQRRSNLHSQTSIRYKTNDIDALALHLETIGLDDDTNDDALDTLHPPGTSNKPFPFLALPPELRLRIYSFSLLFPTTVDLDPTNPRTLLPHLRIFLVSRQVHAESSRLFYTHNTFRIYPVSGRFFHTKYPLLSRLSPTYRSHILTLELRLGPGWTKPPQSWVVDERAANRRRLRLAECTRVHTLKIFVECDPAGSDVFEGFRHETGRGFYTDFCVALVGDLFAHLRTIETVEFDAFPGVRRDTPLVKALVGLVEGEGKTVGWGKERGWDKVVEADLVGGLEMLGM